MLKLFGRNSDMILSALSSAYAEGDSAGFKNDYGVSIKEGKEAVEAFIWHMNHL